MAVDAYLRIDTITGESQVPNFTGQMQMTCFSFGIDNPTSIASGTGGAGAGKVKFDTLSITKQVDSASPQLFAACCAGTHIATGTLSLVKAGAGSGGSGGGAYVTYDMRVIFITSIVTSLADVIPMETVSVVFGSLLFTYKTQSATGVLTPASSKGWNVQTNQAI